MPLAHAEIDAALEAGRQADRARRHRPLPAGRAGEPLAWSRPRRNPRDLSSGRRRPATRRRSSASIWTAPRSISGSTPAAEAIVAAGAAEQARRADALGPGRTARKALGFDELLAGDVEQMKKRSRNYARRQLTWMRKIPNLTTIDRTDLGDREVAERIAIGCGA